MINLFLTLLIAPLFADVPQCEYSGSSFKVTLEGQIYEHRVSPNFSDPKVLCKENYAALYDGYQLVVFEGKTRKFTAQETNANYVGALLVGANHSIAFYDGREFLTYKDGSFQKAEAKPGYYYSQVLTTDSVASLYDGQSVHFFDFKRSKFLLGEARPDFETAEGSGFSDIGVMFDGNEAHLFDAGTEHQLRQTVQQTNFFEVVTAPDRALLYDGYEMYTYCRNKGFIQYPADDHVFPDSGYDAKTDTVWMKFPSGYVNLKSDCELKKM